MSAESERSLNHFALYRFKDSYWQLPDEARDKFHRTWLTALRDTAEKVDLYQIFPTESRIDFVAWSALSLKDQDSTAAFFKKASRAINSYRRLIEPIITLWGYTSGSTYSRARSAQEIDPFSNSRKKYLVIYPFVKTKEWYLLGKDARQGMMNEHIRLGKGYSQISQLLLYSFGVQNQEFVVVYETDDLPLFSDLVRELRETDGRLYTERDTPLHSAIYHPAEEFFELWKTT